MDIDLPWANFDCIPMIIHVWQWSDLRKLGFLVMANVRIPNHGRMTMSYMNQP